MPALRLRQEPSRRRPGRRALAESYPPQCGGASLVVEGLELASVESLTTPAEPEYAHTSWTNAPVELYGVVADGVLAVSEA